jgi:hypothetical protein
VAALLFCCGGVSVIRRAYAERLAESSDATDLDRALRLVPGNAAYWLRRGDLQRRDLESPLDALLHAAALNPFDAEIWIQLGLDAEARGDYAQAEAHLLHAARVSRRYQPRWTLANYYFRRGSANEFWKWTRRALELESEYADAVFQLCWRLPAPAAEILAKAIPPRRNVWRDYARFLLSQNRIDAAWDVLERMLSDARPEDRDLLLEASDRFLAAYSLDRASAAWNALCDRKLIACSSVRDSGAIPLDDADSGGALGHGFAWRIVEHRGISLHLRSGLITVEFSGNQPENAEIVWRWIPVKPGQRGALHFEYQTSGISAASGLAWQVLAGRNAPLLVSSPSLSNSAWAEAQLPFEVPPGVHVVLLRLMYTRPSGSVRIEGTLAVRALRIELAP